MKSIHHARCRLDEDNENQTAHHPPSMREVEASKGREACQCEAPGVWYRRITFVRMASRRATRGLATRLCLPAVNFFLLPLPSDILTMAMAEHSQPTKMRESMDAQGLNKWTDQLTLPRSPPGYPRGFDHDLRLLTTRTATRNLISLL